MQYQLLPSLTKEEYETLKQDIKDRGVQVPIELDEAGNVLDGHHRLMICNELGIKEYPSIVRVGMSEQEKTHHVLALNLDRRHLDKEQRKELVAKLRGMGWTLEAIAETVKVSDEQVRRDVSQSTNVESETITNKRGQKRPAVYNRGSRDQKNTKKALEKLDPDKVPDGWLFPATVIHAAIIDKQEKARDEMANQETGELPIGATVLDGDFRTALAYLPDNSVDLIFTDPPYDEKSIPLYGDLAILGKRILKPGGSLIAYVGHYAIGQIYNLMSDHLRYWWMIAVQHGGNNARLVGKNVFVEWKPMMWFVKEHRANNEMVADLIKSEQPDKEAHDWQQSTIEAEYYIDKLTPPGGLIVDPFAGSGTTLIAALNKRRQVIGVELDGHRANVCRNKVANFNRQPEP